jgi:hypothetical protein
MASSDPPAGRDREVLAGLPNARPTRRSAKRDRPARGQRAGGAAAAPAKAGTKTRQAAPRSTAKKAPARSAAKTSAARSTAKTGTPRSTAKQAAPRSTARQAAAEGRAPAKQAAPRSTAKAGARRSAAPKAAPIPPAGYATPHADDDGPTGADLVTTVVQAAGELAQIGISAGGRALKSALQRLPRP